MATSIRQQKVNSQIQRIVATVLQRDIADPRVDGLVWSPAWKSPKTCAKPRCS